MTYTPKACRPYTVHQLVNHVTGEIVCFKVQDGDPDYVEQWGSKLDDSHRIPVGVARKDYRYYLDSGFVPCRW